MMTMKRKRRQSGIPIDRVDLFTAPRFRVSKVGMPIGSTVRFLLIPALRACARREERRVRARHFRVRGHWDLMSSIVPLNTFTSMSFFVPGMAFWKKISLENCQRVYVGQSPVGKSVTLLLNLAYQSGAFANSVSLNFIEIILALA